MRANPYSDQYEYLCGPNQLLQQRAAPLSVPINLLVCAGLRLYTSSQHIANIYLLCQTAHLTSTKQPTPGFMASFMSNWDFINILVILHGFVFITSTTMLIKKRFNLN